MAAVLHLCEQVGVSTEAPMPEPVLDELFRPYFEGEQMEWVLVGGFDARGHLIAFYGIDDRQSSNALLIPCVRAALRQPSICAIVIAHNHPIGPARPSPQDIAATRQIAALCRLANARLVDHLIYAPQATISLRALGHLH
jgi:RadC-like JAB domain